MNGRERGMTASFRSRGFDAGRERHGDRPLRAAVSPASNNVFRFELEPGPNP
jgi:hypothetical protein